MVQLARARFARFGLTGLAGAVLQLSLFELALRCLHLPGAASMALAVEITVLHNFAWHERFTWSDRRVIDLPQRMLRLWRFHVANGLVSLGGNTLLVYCLVQELGMPPLPSAVAGIVACAPLNFLISDRWVYRRVTSQAEPYSGSRSRIRPAPHVDQAYAPAQTSTRIAN